MTVDKDEILAHLTPELALAAYGIEGRWSGNWLRSKRCPELSHPTDAFGMSHSGKWHCHACDKGGDLMALVAAGEGLDVRADFAKVCEVAAAIAGIEAEDEWGNRQRVENKPRPRRDSGPVMLPIRQRIANASRLANWIWDRLRVSPRAVETGSHWYLAGRGLVWKELPQRVRDNDVRDLGLWVHPDEYTDLAGIHDWNRDGNLVKQVRAIYASGQGVAIPVRHVETGEILDIRARRAEVAEGAPKIMGMPGGVTQEGNEFIACYGHPHSLMAPIGIVVEGWADYLTASCLWPHADVLGAVSAGQYPLVVGFLARSLAERGGRLLLVAQHDPPRRKRKRLRDGTEVDETDEWGEPVLIEGAADIAVNVASKRAIALLGPTQVSWLECAKYQLPGKTGKVDLNDIVRAGRAGEVRRAA